MATSVYLTSISKVTIQLFTLYYQLLSFFIYHAFGLRQGGVIFYLEHRGCELSPSAVQSDSFPRFWNEGIRLPIVRSCTGWNRLSVNCRRRHDFPTPEKRRCALDTPPGKPRAPGRGPGSRERTEPRPRSSPRPPLAPARPAHSPRPAPRALSEVGPGPDGGAPRVTCVSDDDVLEEVSVSHGPEASVFRVRLIPPATYLRPL